MSEVVINNVISIVLVSHIGGRGRIASPEVIATPGYFKGLPWIFPLSIWVN
jgi:hypothetical protein